MAMWRLYYHLVWATKERQPLISPAKETELYSYIIGKADTLNCILHAIGGTENHIHLIVSIPPTQSIAEFVKNIKGSSSRYLNQTLQNSNKFSWQEGYGVFSLGQKQLDSAVAYVINQKEHHLQKTTNSHLEQITDQDNPPTRWHPNSAEN
ncbi:IS200/IS605 family transposase [Microcoleus sp. K5-D4]|uniref:IS200/IS605 family transposase n=1 Tax=Microcoleus sp. K5-D4 TaxID=2818801 RepID=UPI002FCFA21B